MRRLLKRLYWLLTAGFGLALVYSLWLRGVVPSSWKAYGDPASFALISLWVVVDAIWLYHHHFQYRDLQMEQVDLMEGPEFEEFCAYLLKRNGFKRISLTKWSGDQGIDVIGTKKKETVGFQCKRYTGFVGNKAVQEVWAGQNFYKLDHSAVITNSEFSPSARELAEQLDIMLIDRSRLKRMMHRLPS